MSHKGAVAKGPNDGESLELLPGEKVDIAVPNVKLASDSDPASSLGGTLHLTTFRIQFVPLGMPDASHHSKYCVYLGAIFRYEKGSKGRNAESLTLVCRDLRTETYQFPTTGKSVMTTVTKILSKRVYVKSPKELFAFSYSPGPVDQKFYDMDRELQRLGVDCSGTENAWRITDCNKSFSLCAQYSNRLCIPGKITDKQLNTISGFRLKHRVPVLVWQDKKSKASMLRAGSWRPSANVQDFTGVAETTCVEDELIIQTVLDISTVQAEPTNQLFFVDMNDDSPTGDKSGYADQLRRYPDCQFTFLNLPTVQKLDSAFRGVRDLCTPDNMGSMAPQQLARWFPRIVATKWLEYVEALLMGSVQVAKHILNGDSVVICHCNGFECEQAVSSIAQILLDPHYRTIGGFSTLVIKEWIHFSHDFSDFTMKKASRKGNVYHANEFAYFLDAMWQLLYFFPQAFEFNEHLLTFLMESVYSCKYGTFLFSSYKQRIDAGADTKTIPVWKEVVAAPHLYRNDMYTPGATVLLPDLQKNDARLWNNLWLANACRTGLIKCEKTLATATTRSKFQISLILTEMGIPYVPPMQLSKLPHLKVLDLSKNVLMHLPPEIVHLTSLVSLDLRENYLSCLSPPLLKLLASRLTNLSELMLGRNEITSLPAELADFPRLRVVEVDSNRLTHYPDLGGLVDLQILHLGSNQVQVPAWLSRLTSLQKLNLSNMQITDFPPHVTFSRLCNLKALDLSRNSISILPPGMDALARLEILNLTRNPITALPSNVFSLLELTELHLSGLGLGALPGLVGNLGALRVLDVSHNKLTVVPAEMYNLTNLQKLHLNDNRIEQLHMDISKLTGLVVLELQNNALDALSPGVGKLTSLSALDVSHNKIIHIPGVIGYLTKLNNFKYEGNDLKTPPREVVMNGEGAVMEFLRSILQGASPCYRMKLMMVGQENVGKTSLLRCLKRALKPTTKTAAKKKPTNTASGEDNIQGVTAQHNFERTDITDTISTDGIDIDALLLPVKFASEPDKIPVTLSAWDFAGQELYYTTHQFFLSERSVYIMVWNMTTREEESRIEFWLNSVAARAKSAPVIIVGTHLDDPICSKQYVLDAVQAVKNKYSSKFPNIYDVIPVSCSKMIGVDKVMQRLEAIVQQQPYMGEQMPLNYLELEKLVGTEAPKRRPPIVTMEEFSSMGAMVNIKDSKQLLNATDLLHKLGSLVHFAKDSSLKDIVILNPQWLTNLMCTIITTKHQFVKDGILKHSALGQIWRAPDFPPDLHPLLLNLLQKFEISFYMKEDKDDPSIYSGYSLIPALLSETRPAGLDDDWSRFPTDEQQTARTFKFDFIPKGFFSRIMIRALNYAELRHFWRNGMLIEKRGVQKILLEMNPGEKALHVTVRGNIQDNLSRIILETIESLVTGWFSLSMQVFIPCIHCIKELKLYDPYLFPLEECERAAIDGASTVKCRGVRDVRLDLLVPDVVMSQIQNYNIPYTELVLDQVIGEGGFATVYKGRYNNEVVAIKQLKYKKGEEMAIDGLMEETTELHAFAEFRREVWVMSGLRHSNIVLLSGFCLDPCCIVTEFIAHGNLFEYVHMNNGDLAERFVLRVAADIAKGTGYLHSQGMIHRDLKSPNVLLVDLREDAEVVAKVADFGLSQAIASTTKGRSVANPVWLAPEIMEGLEYTDKADVYSFGVILYEMVSRRQFFQDINFMATLENTVIQGGRPEIPAATPPPIHELIVASWQGSPEDRPPFASVISSLSRIFKQMHPDLHDRAMTEYPPPMRVVPVEEMDSEEEDSTSRSDTDRIDREDLSLAPTYSSIMSSPSAELTKLSGTLNSLVVASEEKISQMKTLLPAVAGSIQCLLHVREDTKGNVINLVFCGDGEGQITVWDPTTERLTTTVQAHSSKVLSLLHHGDHMWSCSSDKTVRVWSLPDLKCRKEIKSNNIISLARVSQEVWGGSYDMKLFIFNSKKFSLKKKFSAQLDANVVGTIGSLLWVGGANGDMVWIGTHREIIRASRAGKLVDMLQGHEQVVHNMILVAAEVWSCSTDKTIRVWNAQSGEPIKVLTGHTGRVFALVNESDYFVWSGSWDKSIMIWNAQGHCFARECDEEHTDAVSCLLHVGTKIWSGSWDKTLHTWASLSGQQPKLPPPDSKRSKK
mmetsp:Transcript_33003/g.82965  ORF Transcript_33003/g.82965 Transcript_33003/m.82965 type:complete len:2143 (+) Transcript_33003:102-6530(+)